MKKPTTKPMPVDAPPVVAATDHQFPINVDATNVVRMLLRDHVEKMEPGTKAIVAPSIQAILNSVVVLTGPTQ